MSVLFVWIFSGFYFEEMKESCQEFFKQTSKNKWLADLLERLAFRERNSNKKPFWNKRKKGYFKVKKSPKSFDRSPTKERWEAFAEREKCLRSPNIVKSVYIVEWLYGIHTCVAQRHLHTFYVLIAIS